jgi:hypothetical protein
MKKVALVMCLILAVALVMGCGGKKQTWRPEGSPGYIDMQGKKFLVMPVDMRYVEGDKTKMSAALFGGFVAEFGESGIPLQPIQPALEAAGVGDLGYKLARGMTHAAFFHNKSVWDGCGGEDYSVVPNMLKTLVEKVAELLERPDIKFDYIVVLHIDTLGAGTVPKTTKLRVMGGMYDTQKDEIAVAFQWDQTTAEDTLLAEMATIGPKAVGIMAGKNPNPPPAEEAKPAEEEKPAEEKPAEEKPAEEAPAEEKPAE